MTDPTKLTPEESAWLRDNRRIISDTDSLVAHCSCGACYTLGQFRALPAGGIQEVDGAWLELRGCRCGSHLSIWVDAAGRLTEAPSWARGDA